MKMSDELQKSELDLLKEQADIMGIEYANNVNAKTLKKRIAEKLNAHNEQDDNDERFELERENLKLVHVIITPMDSTKRELSHVTFAVGNSVLGTIKRVVPMGKATLIENILYKHIKEQEFQYMYPVPDPANPRNTITESKLVKAYAIQDLPLPTEQEIKELAKAQVARQSVDME